MRTREQVELLMRSIFEECIKTYSTANREYASEANALANFEDAGADMNVPSEVSWWMYYIKHQNGVRSWIRGFRSQREDVRGRIKDMIVYLVLLWAIVEDREYAAKRVSETSGSDVASGSHQAGQRDDVRLRPR